PAARDRRARAGSPRGVEWSRRRSAPCVQAPFFTSVGKAKGRTMPSRSRSPPGPFSLLLFFFVRRVAVARGGAFAGLAPYGFPTCALGLFAHHAGHVGHLVALFERHHAPALRVAADDRGPAHRAAGGPAVGRGDHAR